MDSKLTRFGTYDSIPLEAKIVGGKFQRGVSGFVGQGEKSCLRRSVDLN